MRLNRTFACLTAVFACLPSLMGWQNLKYPVEAIPKPLLENASVVVRLSELQVTIANPGSMTIKCREVRTILKEGGVTASELQVGYNSLIRVGAISGTIFDARGEKVRNIKSDEIIDFTAFDGFSIYSDTRVKFVNPKHYNYPFTVEYQYDLTFKTALYLPSFYVYEGSETSVEKAVYQLTVPSGYPVHYMEFNGMPPCLIVPAGKNNSYSWHYENFTAKKSEPYQADPTELYPYVLLSPGDYSIEGFSGKADSWEVFSTFFHKLLDGKQALPGATEDHVKNLVSGMDNDHDRIAAIYRYSQTKNRYVSIQVGIGGIVPFDASTVDRFSYGDCKALSNYVMSLLKVAGIRSYYTLVYAGENNRPVRQEMVTDYFNHVILCVPLNGDTIWLECTNPYSPVNYLGTFTDDRYVLLVSETGGKLVKTPAYSHDNNSAVVFSDVVLSADGKASVTQRGVYSGTYYSEQQSLTLMDEKDRHKALLRSIPIPDITISNCEIAAKPGDPRVISKKLAFEANNCLTRSGDMLLVKQGLVSGTQSVPAVSRRRESPVVIKRNNMAIDSTCFHMPAGYVLEVIPQDIVLSNDMASCSFSYTIDGNRLSVVRKLGMNKGVYQAERFNEFRDLLEKIARRDEERLVFKRVTM